MILSLILLSCANKAFSELEEGNVEPEVDAKTGVMVPESSAYASEVAPRRVVMPAGEVVTRECFGSSRGRSAARASSPSGGSTSGSSNVGAGSSGVSARAVAQNAPATPAPSPVASAAPPPAADPATSTPAARPTTTTSKSSTVAKAPQASPVVDMVAAQAVAESSPADDGAAYGGVASGGGGLGWATGGEGTVGTGAKGKGDSLARAEKKAQPAKEEADESNRKPAEPRADTRGRDKDVAATLGDSSLGTEREMAGPGVAGATREQAERQARRSNLDFGAKTYLSNDDSMSLASAQRLLWAVQNKGPVKTSEVRPHEFLNYFSFDTADVPRGDTFSVLASAEDNGNGEMTMAFAVKGATPPRQPLDLTLVLDRSGSMSAEGRMEYLKRGLTKMTGQLERGDRVDLVLFDDKVCAPLENFVVGRDDPSLLTDVIAQLQPRGSTDMDAGLRAGYKIANARDDGDDRNRRMLLISDALLNTGEVDHDVVSEVGRAYEESNIRLSAIGVGRDFNDSVLDMLSEKGKGAYVYLGSEAVVDRVFGAGFGSLTQTIAHDVHFALDLPDSLAIERFYGEESSTNKADVQAIHYYAGTTQLFLQDLAMRDGRPVKNDPVTLTVEWTDPASGDKREQVFTSTVGKLLGADDRNLHKGQALMAWTDLILARSMGGNPCGSAYDTWAGRVQNLGADAEIAWLDGLTAPLCGQAPASTKLVASRGVPYKVKVDSDQVIAEVGMECGRSRDSVELSGSVARFEAQPGACKIVLYGNVPMYAAVDVPSTGGDVRCVVRGGRLSCG